ncbi:MAG: hypothetical protein MZV70_46270 [Desulfobacterales bacterium]|nr:hypothetical protein [Desulfobacterales bacterium]
MALLISSIKKLKRQIFCFLPAQFTTGIFHPYGNAISTAVFSTVIRRLYWVNKSGLLFPGRLAKLIICAKYLEATVAIQHAGLVGFVSDDMGSPAEINIGLQNMASRSVAQSKLGYIPPPTFYQVAGKQIIPGCHLGQVARGFSG